jgi:glutathione peroxidase
VAIELQQIPIKTIDGEESDLGRFSGKVLLVVNVASKCGFTPQYEALETLFTKYRDKGFAVLGFPANNFGEQEPGNDAEIAVFSADKYAVDFPMFSKISVAGEDKHPLYEALTDAQPIAVGSENLRRRLEARGMAPNPAPEILWNFEKFLIGRDGTVVARFAPDMAPDDDAIISAIEQELFASE